MRQQWVPNAAVPTGRSRSLGAASTSVADRRECVDCGLSGAEEANCDAQQGLRSSQVAYTSEVLSRDCSVNLILPVIMFLCWFWIPPPEQQRR